MHGCERLVQAGSADPLAFTSAAGTPSGRVEK
jgi:hypothetical protein